MTPIIESGQASVWYVPCYRWSETRRYFVTFILPLSFKICHYERLCKPGGGSTHWDTLVLLVTSKEIGLEVNAEKTKHMVMSFEQNVGENNNIKKRNKSYESVVKFK